MTIEEMYNKAKGDPGIFTIFPFVPKRSVGRVESESLLLIKPQEYKSIHVINPKFVHKEELEVIKAFISGNDWKRIKGRYEAVIQTYERLNRKRWWQFWREYE